MDKDVQYLKVENFDEASKRFLQDEPRFEGGQIWYKLSPRWWILFYPNSWQYYSLEENYCSKTGESCKSINPKDDLCENCAYVGHCTGKNDYPCKIVTFNNKKDDILEL